MTADIARAYLPSRWHYHYARHKLAMDPLYGGVCAALAGARGPVLDFGCGIGLLAHALRARGIPLEYLGIDSDSAKIDIARRSMQRGGITGATFLVGDLTQDFPRRQGDVVLLDVLQYLPPQRHLPLLDLLSDCLAPGARLVIRTGFHEPGWRAKLTHIADAFGHALRWMNTGPKRYPGRQELLGRLQELGLKCRVEPLHAGTPFNNWLVVAQKVAIT